MFFQKKLRNVQKVFKWLSCRCKMHSSNQKFLALCVLMPPVCAKKLYCMNYYVVVCAVLYVMANEKAWVLISVKWDKRPFLGLCETDRRNYGYMNRKIMSRGRR